MCGLAVAKPVSYNRDIRPILSDKCFSCHGLDAKHREADMRLDTAEGAYGKAESGAAIIVLGNLLDSEAWKRIISTDKDEVMPPPKSHKTLTDDEKAIIKRRIEGGTVYEKHWAFVPAKRLAIPSAETQNAIDFLIASSLQKAGLSISNEADRSTLLRRLTLDLTGLPPTPEELHEFLNDKNAGAYERQVERLLASPRHGEQMAVAWLDLARYGDTNGY